MANANIQTRIDNLRKKLNEQALDAAVVLSVENRVYFSQFNGSSGALLISKNKALLFTDARYMEIASQKSKEYEVIRHKKGLVESVVEYLNENNLRKVGVESSLMISQYKIFEEKFPKGTTTIFSDAIMELRKIKDEYEISCIKKGVQLCTLAFEHIVNFIKPGMSEKEIALELEYTMRKNGADNIKGGTVVASGERSAIPHGVASDRIVQEGDFVKMDYGAIVSGYYSDFSRTVVIREPTEKQREVHQVVKETSEHTLQHIKSGMPSGQVDQIARAFLHEKGYGEYFVHSAGHALGLNIHETPILHSTNETILEPGMAITVEPGVYIPGWGGVRIEDLIIIREDGFENLTEATKELLEISVQ